ncbi:glutathione-disulfide reductase [Chiayiivirga flava]|uniref:Glutathione reductase (NADPH) n=1 Tax=Chiayiivirga flava TaxID=659595 RepID=A0A7W8D858_9GAMM|nr:glutathione-disulfide reductase [Chiayiivirga flava]MBB5209382.1 glutathione reductase (NADPH) [Chiayiivirga flava]
MSDAFDLIVLGGGSGGIAGAIRAARHGARVAMLEPGNLGGTCVHVGCVPKKIMWLAADIAQTLAYARTYGFAVPDAVPLDWSALVARRQGYIDNARNAYLRRCHELGIELVPEYGRFDGPGRIVAGTRTLTAPHVLIATGGHSVLPALPGAALGIDSNGFFALRAAPRRVAIVGGGYIGVELAGVLRGLGSTVDLFVRGQRALPSFDAELGTHLADSMRAQGIGLHVASEVRAVERDGDGVRLQFSDDRAAHRADVLLWAIGRAPSAGALGLDRVGVRRSDSGHIVVDALQATNVPGIHAVGDVTTQPALTPAATATARGLADRLFGTAPGFVLDPDQVPTVVFSHPPTASVGLSEDDACARFGRGAVHAHRRSFRPMRGAIGGDEARTFLKLVCVGDDERVLGVHMHGAQVDEMLQGFAVALRAGARKADFDATLAIHPTAAEELVLMH